MQTEFEIGSDFELNLKTWPNLVTRLLQTKSAYFKTIQNQIAKLESSKQIGCACALETARMLDGSGSTENSDFAKARKILAQELKKLGWLELKKDTKALKIGHLKFNIDSWIKLLGSEKVRKGTSQSSESIELIYGYLFCQLITRICNILREIQKSNRFGSKQFIKFNELQFYYYFNLLEYSNHILTYKKSSEKSGLQTELQYTIDTLRKIKAELEYFFNIWKERLILNFENMKIRDKFAELRNNLKFTISHIELIGMKGDLSKGKILLGNSSNDTLELNLIVAFPTKDWSLIKPEARYSDGFYTIENFAIAPKKTRILELEVSFPKSSLGKEYISIIKINPTNMKLIPESITKLVEPQ